MATVSSARNAVPRIFLCGRTRSTECRWPPCCISGCSSIQSLPDIFPVISWLNPTPNTASMITVYSFSGCSVYILIPIFCAIFSAACTLRSGILTAGKQDLGLLPASAWSLATANLSLLLLLLPHTTRALKHPLSCPHHCNRLKGRTLHQGQPREC